MSLAQLYTICLDRIHGYLKVGMWNFYFENNPLSELLTLVVHNLMDLTQSSGQDPPKVGDVLVLLTSGRLRRLDLCPFQLEEDWNSIAHRIGFNSFLYNIISWNPYLEELYLVILPDFEVLRKCQNLQILRIYKLCILGIRFVTIFFL
ncbi:hypothetical protein AVEN_231708-1 [Araneus ventricosus]|uniref:Uncharacterized protein n=1 Tax=Araneus ventricosus TaxID=182803 RepID=A0A4Y2R3N5_ARAVE|nr:hypothetical protein AVEN_231708-1 [Araneus ventricosus]